MNIQTFFARYGTDRAGNDLIYGRVWFLLWYDCGSCGGLCCVPWCTIRTEILSMFDFFCSTTRPRALESTGTLNVFLFLFYRKNSWSCCMLGVRKVRSVSAFSVAGCPRSCLEPLWLLLQLLWNDVGWKRPQWNDMVGSDPLWYGTGQEYFT